MTQQRKQHNSIHVYSKESPNLFNGAYSQASAFRIAALVYKMELKIMTVLPSTAHFAKAPTGRGFLEALGCASVYSTFLTDGQ